MKDNPPPITVRAELTTNCKWMNSNYGDFWFIFSYNICLCCHKRKKTILYIHNIPHFCHCVFNFLC